MQSIYGFRHANVSLFVRGDGRRRWYTPNKPRARHEFSLSEGLRFLGEHPFRAFTPREADLRLGAIPQTKAEAHQEKSVENAVQIHVYPDDRTREADAWQAEYKPCEKANQ